LPNALDLKGTPFDERAPEAGRFLEAFRRHLIGPPALIL
jgi:hypothetical protein